MERNIKLTLMYDGSEYHGWQLQENAVTVQQKVNEALSQIFNKKINVNGCSRTDTGVHANMFCCNFTLDNNRDCEKIRQGMNGVLPYSISVLKCEEKELSFHSRFDCKGKEYIYKIWNGKSRNPFLKNYALFYPYRIDESLLNEESRDFVGRHDFTAFCASGSEVEDKVRTIYEFKVCREGDMVIISVKGDGFLYNMVRIMVGTLLDINSGKIPKGSIKEIIESRDRRRSGVTAKSEGLYLNKVFY